MNKKTLLSIIMALVLCFTTIVPAATAPAYADADNAVLGEQQLLMAEQSNLWEDDSWTTEFSAERPCMMYFDLKAGEYYYSYYQLTLINTDTNEIMYDEEGSVDDEEPFYDAIGLDPGNYKVTITNTGYASRYYDFTVSYAYFYTEEDPMYSLDQGTLELYTGRSQTLSVGVFPESALVPAVNWSSNRPDIAAVDQDGKVTAIAAGTAVITANLNGQNLTCDVTVNAPEYTSLNYKSLPLFVGESEKLDIAVIPEEYGLDGLTWTSSNSKVATVNANGLVTAKAKGTATITAAVNGVTRTCKVTVKPMALSKTKTTVYVKKTQKLAVNGGTGKTTWKSGNKKVATVNANGVVKGIKPGTATITAKKNGKTFKCKVTVKWEPETGIVTTKTYNVSYSDDYDINMNGPGKISLTIKNTDSGDYADNLDVSISNPNYKTILDVSVAPGKTKTVSVNTSARGEFSLYCYGYGKVTMKKTTKPALSKTSMSVGKGYTGNLKVYGVKNGGKWSSSNKKIATVTSKGVVKGKKKGTCYIKYTLKTGKVIKCKVTVVNPVTCKVTSVYDTSIYNECWVKFTNYTNKKITYIKLNISQYDNRGYKVSKNSYDYSWFYVNDTLKAKSSDSWEFKVNDDAKKCKAYITKVYFADGTTWTP